MKPTIIVTTGNEIEGQTVQEYLGVVRGLAVRVPTPGQGFQALGNVLSGDWQAGAKMYEKVCESARELAFQRMIEHAVDLDADAIIAMRYDATEAGESATEVLAYGTAVKVKLPDALPVTT